MQAQVRSMGLAEFLDAKPLYYDEIDYTRMPRAYASVKERLKVPKVIHLVGTNGKGTTGRFLANALVQSGCRVGHYTSPHILRFNERIWLNGEDVSDAALEKAHSRLLEMLDEEMAGALSYFEYTTLLAMLLFETCEWVVLEAGLGGEHDATNVFAKELSVFTPIDFDHQAFLGSDIDAIAKTKLRSMGPAALIGLQRHSEVYEHFDIIAKEKRTQSHRIQDILTPADHSCVEKIAKSANMPRYLQENLLLAIGALKVLGIAYRCEWFEAGRLFGRLSALNEQVSVDVGHNALAAEAICNTLYPEKVVLVYNSYKDKAYGDILTLLKPVIKRVEIIDVDDGRIEERSMLEAALDARHIAHAGFDGVKEDERYLVFGSFSVVETFLKEYYA